MDPLPELWILDASLYTDFKWAFVEIATYRLSFKNLHFILRAFVQRKLLDEQAGTLERSVVEFNRIVGEAFHFKQPLNLILEFRFPVLAIALEHKSLSIVNNLKLNFFSLLLALLLALQNLLDLLGKILPLLLRHAEYFSVLPLLYHLKAVLEIFFVNFEFSKAELESFFLGKLRRLLFPFQIFFIAHFDFGNKLFLFRALYTKFEILQLSSEENLIYFLVIFLFNLKL